MEYPLLSNRVEFGNAIVIWLRYSFNEELPYVVERLNESIAYMVNTAANPDVKIAGPETIVFASEGGKVSGRDEKVGDA